MNRVLAISLVLLTASSVWPQGYRLEAGRLVVEPNHWQEWNVPEATLDFNDDGVRPIKIRAQINAALDARDFTYGDERKD